MKKAIEFFYKGPGALILITAVVIGLGIWMRQKQDKKVAEEAKHETHRDLGTLNPKTAIDPNAVPQEEKLDKREIAPAYRSEPAPTPQAPIVNSATAPLPTAMVIRPRSLRALRLLCSCGAGPMVAAPFYTGSRQAHRCAGVLRPDKASF